MKRNLTLTTVLVLVLTITALAGRSRSYIFRNSKMINGDAHASGSVHSLEIRGGHLYTWGDNTWGELGNNSNAMRNYPGVVGTDSTWAQVAAGYGASYAIKSNGTLWAWGLNSYGGLGNGNTTEQHSPVQIGTDTKWVTVSAGTLYAMAIKADGTLWGWGANGTNQLGIGDTAARHSPVQIGNDNKWISISCGYEHTIGIKSDGTMWVWGYNFYGQLGVNDTITRTVPSQLGSDNKWVSASCGLSHTLALKVDGTLWAWGNNNAGQVGFGISSKQKSPGQVNSDTKWVTVSCGDYFSSALKADGTLWCWGLNNFGQLGDGTTTWRFSPVQIGSSIWAGITSGGDHTSAWRADGSVWSWGYNTYGQLGTSNTSEQHAPVNIETTDNKWLGAAGGGGHSIGVKSNGTLWSWGANQYGQLGRNGTTNDALARQVGVDNKWVVVSSGHFHNAALKSDGTIWTWGNNNFGQLGTGNTTQAITPIQVGTDNKWVAVCCGYFFTLAIKSDGTLWAWGNNSNGQLGNGTTTNQLSPVQVGTDNKWASISCGSGHVEAIKSDGTLWAWGYNLYGNLGDGTTTDRHVPVQIGSDTKWVSIGSGFNHNCSIKSDGTLWSWGSNDSAQLGNGNNTDQHSPIMIGTDVDWVSITCGGDHSIAIKANGTLWAWGKNDNGQLGIPGQNAPVHANGPHSISPVQQLNPMYFEPTQVGALVTWSTTSCGEYFTLGIKIDGGDFCSTGNNDFGQLGTGDLLSVSDFICNNNPCDGQEVPTLSATSTTNCGTQGTDLSIFTGSLNIASSWQWYTGSCGGTSIGSGNSITVSPTTTTTYYVRGEGGCTSPESCQNITITVITPPVCQNGGTVNSNCGCNCPSGYSGQFCEHSNCIVPDVPSINASSLSNCGTQNTTLSISTGSLNSASNWQWYSGSCGGTSEGSGTSISVSPTATTTYYVRGEGGCITPGSCASVTIEVNTPTTWYHDADGDGFGNPNETVVSCTQPTGYVSDNSDCDDSNSQVHTLPSTFSMVFTNITTTSATVSVTPLVATEYYDIAIQNGPTYTHVLLPYGLTGLTPNTSYFISPSYSGSINCINIPLPDGFTTNSICSSPTIPGLITNANNNCGSVNTTIGVTTGSLNSASHWQWYSGSCGGTIVGSGSSINVSPSVTTTYYVRGEGNCVTPGNCASITITVTTPTTWYQDIDGDGFGNPNVTFLDCSQPPGFVADGTDCDDHNNQVHTLPSSFSMVITDITSTSATISANPLVQGMYYYLYPTNDQPGLAVQLPVTINFLTPTTTYYYSLKYESTVVCGNSIVNGSFTTGINCNQPSIPTISASANNFCSGPSATLTITSGSLNDATHWQWYTGGCGGTSVGSGTSITVTPSDTTTYYVRGEGGCATLGSCDSITLNVKRSPGPHFLDGGTPYCSGSDIWVYIPTLSGYSYHWNNGATTSSLTIDSAHAIAGDNSYAVTITAPNGCTVVDSLGPIAQSPVINYTVTPLGCNGGAQLTVNISLGVTPYNTNYYDQNGNPTYGITANPIVMHVSVGGNYDFTTTAGDGVCQCHKTITITAPPSLHASSTSGTIPCGGGTTTLTVTASGGASPYTGTGTFTVGGGTYTHIVTDAHGCTSTTVHTVVSSFNPTIGASGPGWCTNESNFAEVAPPLYNQPAYASYLWSNGSTAQGFSIDSGATAGPRHYSVTVTDINGCTGVATLDQTISPGIYATYTVTSPVQCFGGTAAVSFNVTGGTTPFTFDNGGTSQSVTAGTHTFTVSDINYCAAIINYTITQPSLLTATSSIGNFSCTGGTSTVVVTGHGGTAPYTGTGTFSVTPGTYTYTVTDHNGCTATTSVTISNPPALIAAATSGTITCNGGTTTVNVSASGGFPSYTGTGTHSVHAGTYTYTVTDSTPYAYDGCTATVTVTITQPTPISFTATPANPVPCTASNGRITFSASGGTGILSFSKNGGGTFITSNQFLSLASGTYTCQVKDGRGCTSTKSVIRVGCQGREIDENTDEPISSLNIFPNPAHDHLTIEFNSANADNYHLRVMDMIGQTMLSQNSTSVVGDNQIQLNLNSLAKGIYLLDIQKGDAILIKKIVIQ